MRRFNDSRRSQLSCQSRVEFRPIGADVGVILGVSPAFLSISWDHCNFACIAFSWVIAVASSPGITTVSEDGLVFHVYLPAPTTCRAAPLTLVPSTACRAPPIPVVSAPPPRVRPPRTSLVSSWCRRLACVFHIYPGVHQIDPRHVL